MTLEELGWNDFFKATFHEFEEKGLKPARIAVQQKQSYRVFSEIGELTAVIAGKLRHEATSPSDFPVVGDWVAIRRQADEQQAVIHGILPRKTQVVRNTSSRKSRTASGETQTVVANVDTIFLVSALDQDFNPRRIERYLTMIWESGAKPVVLLNKADLAADAEDKKQQVENIALGVDIYVTSAKSLQGLEQLQTYLLPGRTVALLGSSGVGKSTLINKLVGADVFKVAEIGDYKDKGQHTTTHRELILLENGSILIDNPGMRAIQLLDADEGLGLSFQDIEAFAEQCRFNDCRHLNEPGCAVKQAIRDGELDQSRYEGYQKLQKEVDHQIRKSDPKERSNPKKRWKAISKTARDIKKTRDKL